MFSCCSSWWKTERRKIQMHQQGKMHSFGQITVKCKLFWWRLALPPRHKRSLPWGFWSPCQEGSETWTGSSYWCSWWPPPSLSSVQQEDKDQRLKTDQQNGQHFSLMTGKSKCHFWEKKTTRTIVFFFSFFFNLKKANKGQPISTRCDLQDSGELH